MHDFEANDFRKELNELVKFQSDFLNYMQVVVSSGQTGSCRTFYNYRNEMIVSQAGYRNVPAAWYPLYYEYRLLLQEAVGGVQAITSVCDAGGGTITPEQDQAIIQLLTSVIERGQGLVARAQAIP